MKVTINGFFIHLSINHEKKNWCYPVLKPSKHVECIVNLHVIYN